MTNSHYCHSCGVYSSHLSHHACGRRLQEGGAQVDASDQFVDPYFTEFSRSHQGTMLNYIHVYEASMTDVSRAFDEAEEPVKRLLENRLEIYGSLVAKVVAIVIMKRQIVYSGGFNFERRARIHFTSPNYDIFSAEETRDFLIMSCAQILEDIKQFQQNGSGWTVENVESINVQLGELRLLAQVSPGNYLKFPLSPRKGYVHTHL